MLKDEAGILLWIEHVELSSVSKNNSGEETTETIGGAFAWMFIPIETLALFIPLYVYEIADKFSPTPRTNNAGVVFDTTMDTDPIISTIPVDNNEELDV